MKSRSNIDSFDLKLVYQQYDNYIRHELDQLAKDKIRTTCQPGCHVCCDMSVNLSLIEARAIQQFSPRKPYLRAVNKGRKVLNFARKHRLSDHDLYFYKFRKELGFCSFLNDERQCGIYGVRSLSCRGLYSGLHPDFCRFDLEQIKSGMEIDKALSTLDRDIFGGTPYIQPLFAAGDSFSQLIKKYSVARYGFHLEGEMHFLLYILNNRVFAQALKRVDRFMMGQLLDTENFPPRILKLHRPD